MFPVLARAPRALCRAGSGRGKVGVLGFEVWQVKSGTIFDSIMITDDEAEASAYAEETYTSLVEAEKKAKDAADEAKKAAEKEAEKEDTDDDEDNDEEDDDEEEKDEL